MIGRALCTSEEKDEIINGKIVQLFVYQYRKLNHIFLSYNFQKYIPD